MIPSNMKEFGIKYDQYKEWYYNNNTFSLRCKRWIKTVTHCKKLNINISYHYKDHLLERLKKYERTTEIDKIINMFNAVD